MSNFMLFQQMELDFSSNINVIAGKNSTGNFNDFL